MADSGMMPDLITCKSSGATYNATWIPSTGSWISHRGMSAADATAKHATYKHPIAAVFFSHEPYPERFSQLIQGRPVD